MKTTRRSFVGAAGAFSALLVTPLPRAALAAAPDAGTSPDAGLANPAAKPSAELSRLTRERYGKFLREDQLAMLDEKLANVEANSKRLQSVKLKNGDEPVADFRAVRP